MTIAAVLLAAGGGSRFAGSTHKLLATIGGVPVFRRALDHVSAAGFDHVIVVTGAVALDIDEPRVITVAQLDVATGTGGFATARALAAATTSTATSWSSGSPINHSSRPRRGRPSPIPPRTAPIVVATYDGVRGPNPVRLQRSVWPHLPTDGDEGARTVMRLHPDWVDEVACEGSAADIDTLEDLGQWTNF